MVLSPKWIMQLFINTFVTMVLIYFIKKAADKWNIPVVKTVADAV